ncbi:heavy metal translocatin [Boletus reticuloceps]|uniref:Heavy metal translocatin n=1 Tax=Boletus reticuloceps TaxID=495285 RepID=A0A8I2YYA6_9AGAM|nr:heavy metal translocatin [Boletus reticuloceps]
MDTTNLFLSNLHCTSCARSVEQSLSALDPAPLSVVVSVASSSVSLCHHPALSLSRIKAALDDAGFHLLTDSPPPTPRVQQCAHHRVPLAPSTPTPHSITLSVSGMSCASCVNTITDMLSPIPGVSDVVVSLLTSSATLRIDNIALLSSVTDTLDDCGFEAEVVSAEPILPSSPSSHSGTRTLSLRVDGMYCRRCPNKVVDVLRVLDPNIIITKPFVDHTHPIIEISYQPAPPNFTIRSIIACIQSADPAFKVSPHHPPTLEQRARSMQLHERTLLLNRLFFTFLAAVPTFILSVVYANLAPPGNSSKAYLMQPMWNGNASRTQWSLFFLATPVMFYSASLFHYRSIREILAMWRKGSSTPIIARFTRFGSMNLLVSIGVSVAYFASVVLLALAASQPPASNGVGDSTTYFDSVVLLTFFLLTGRYLEAYSKARTADAITALASLRPPEALLLTPRDPSDVDSYSSNADLEKGDPEKDDLAIVPGHQIQKIYVDLLEVGDIVRVLNGATPPSDGTVVSGAGTSFDESSLTGEAKLITKKPGDQVFLGTINKEKAVDVRVDAVGGLTMLDQIVRIVREGRVRRAPIERIADMVTSIFVPVITLLAIITWVVWLALGLGGGIPRDYLDADTGGWTVWSLEFAIAVFVVACPCGIALAAPTALLVGSGLAAKHGILARGGGEAFQEMAQVDTVVFDKTGTLTSGGQPQVSNFEVTSGSTWTSQSILGIAAELESASSHPLGTAVKQYATKHEAAHLSATGFDEVAGRGVKAYFDALGRTALIGNENWMREHGVILDSETTSRLAEWTTEAKSIALVAISDDDTFSVVATFAVTDSLRPEAPDVIRILREKGIETWMISGDHEQTAKAVAKMVGIPETNVLAGVLPHQKAEKIEWLQANGVKRRGSRWQRLSEKKMNKRCIVAMVGDGINDAPALAASDIGIAIGSGSDVAISSASFILLSSNLKSLLTLSDLSRKVFNRVKQNFAWAFMYNIVAIPVAAGVIYPVGHARLTPVWAALAMAFSSVSVVVSSLLLRLYKEPKV